MFQMETDLEIRMTDDTRTTGMDLRISGKVITVGVMSKIRIKY